MRGALDASLALLRPSFEEGARRFHDLRVVVYETTLTAGCSSPPLTEAESRRRFVEEDSRFQAARKRFEDVRLVVGQPRIAHSYVGQGPRFEIQFLGDADGATRFMELATTAGACLEAPFARECWPSRATEHGDRPFPWATGALWVRAIFWSAWQHERGALTALKHHDPELGPDGFASALPINPFLASMLLIDRLTSGPTNRLTVSLNPPQAVLKGKPFVISTDAATLLDALLKAPGQWVSGASLELRTSRVVKGLPQEIRELVEAEPGKGVRLQLA